jgi:hypothetical protein
MLKGLLWSRLHYEDLDLAYSFIFNTDNESDSKLYLLHNKIITEFSDLDYHVRYWSDFRTISSLLQKTTTMKFQSIYTTM